MSNQRFSPEFKNEAVRQIVDRGYSVAEVSERLGVSAHSLYKWVKAAVALANKNARIIWALLARGECYQSNV